MVNHGESWLEMVNHGWLMADGSPMRGQVMMRRPMDPMELDFEAEEEPGEHAMAGQGPGGRNLGHGAIR